MANDTTGQFWKLDTAAVITTRPVFIKRIIWDSPTTAEHDIVIQDNAGGKIWEMKAIAAGTGIVYKQDVELSVGGFNLATLDSGTVYVHIR